MTTNQTITESVRERYGSIASSILNDQPTSGCCTPSAESATCCDDTSNCCGATSIDDAITSNLYAVEELDGVPLKAALASLGCGNPTALAELRAGETVLDLGSGGGIDVLLSAKRVGATGFAYGLDMTDSMLELARRNAAEAGVSNVEFLKGDIANIPLPDNSVDVIISNCVINLAADKAPVVHEAFRVLKPNGRFAVSDIVIQGGLPLDADNNQELRRSMSAWAGCIAGALTDDEYRTLLHDAGFTNIDLEVTRRYDLDGVRHLLPDWMLDLDPAVLADAVGRFTSMFVRAQKV